MSANGPAYSLLAESVTIRRGDDVLVEDFDWRHEPGRIAWITGPNGAGKSTLIRVLAGIAKPDDGVVRRFIGGDRPADSGSVAHYNPSMSLPRETFAPSFAALMSRLVEAPPPLTPDRTIQDKRAAALSTGEEKRLLLGPILARGRPFLFLDEPYEHLSREARTELTSELVRIARTSVVVVATNQPIPPDASGPVVNLSIEEAPGVNV